MDAISTCPALPVELVCFICECLIDGAEFRSLAALARTNRTYCAAATDELMWEHFTCSKFSYMYQIFKQRKERPGWHKLATSILSVSKAVKYCGPGLDYFYPFRPHSNANEKFIPDALLHLLLPPLSRSFQFHFYDIDTENLRNFGLQTPLQSEKFALLCHMFVTLLHALQFGCFADNLSEEPIFNAFDKEVILHQYLFEQKQVRLTAGELLWCLWNQDYRLLFGDVLDSTMRFAVGLVGQTLPVNSWIYPMEMMPGAPWMHKKANELLPFQFVGEKSEAAQAWNNTVIGSHGCAVTSYLQSNGFSIDWFPTLFEGVTNRWSEVCWYTIHSAELNKWIVSHGVFVDYVDEWSVRPVGQRGRF